MKQEKALNSPFWLAFTSMKKKSVPLSVGVILFNVLAAILEGASFAFLIISLQLASGTKPLFSFFDSLWFFGKEPSQQAITFIILAVVSQIAKSAFTYLGQIFMTRLGTHLQTFLQAELFKNIFHLPYLEKQKHSIGEFTDAVQAPVQAVPHLADALNRLLTSLLMIGSLGVVLLALSFSMSCLLVVLFLFLSQLQKWSMRKVGKVSVVYADRLAQTQKAALNTLMGLREIQQFDLQKIFLNRVENHLKDSANYLSKLSRWNHLLIPLQEVVGVVALSAIFIFAFTFEPKEIGVDSLIAFLTIAYRLNTRLQIAVGAIGTFSYHKGFLKKIHQYLQMPSCEEEKKFDTPAFQHAISFQNVSFRYSSEHVPSLDETTFVLPKGKSLAIVGHSGAGKSTLLNLLAGLFYPSDGKIFIDGMSLENASLRSWRKKIAMVSQDAYLFEGTIEDNITLGAIEPVSKEVVEEIAHLAGLEGLIKQLPTGLQTNVGERGCCLSSGEKQRIALARALIRKPELLLLDEATSHLDSETEAFIQETLQALKGKVTIILVAHRLSTVRTADQILVLDKGKILQRGTHDELLSKKGLYQQFWMHQMPLQEVDKEKFLVKET